MTAPTVDSSRNGSPAVADLPPLGQAAVAYAERGWLVFPLRPCDKRPMANADYGLGPDALGGFTLATRQPDVVAGWWRRWPDANIGCRPGPSGFVVLDLDGPEGEAAAQRLGLLAEPTLEVATGREDGGRHRWYRHPGGHIGNASLAPKLDVRADTGYVVLPPSIHPSGRPYHWLDELEEVADLPVAVVAELRRTGNGSRPPGAPLARDIPALETIPSGSRNGTLTSYAGRLLAKGHPVHEATDLCLALNVAKCRPPLPTDEVGAIVASVAKREERKARKPEAEAPASEEVVWQTLSELVRRPELLVPPRAVVPRFAYEGRVTLLAAREKDGKSTLCRQAVAALLQAGAFLGETVEPARVAWLALDEPPGDLVRGLVELGASAGMIIAEQRPDFVNLEATIQREDCQLLVVDTLTEFCGGLVDDANSPTEMRPILAGLRGIARRTNCAVLVVHHLTKSGSGYADSRQIGAGVDVIIEMRPGEEPPTRRTFKVRGRGVHGDFSLDWHRDGGYSLATGELSLDARILATIEATPGISLNRLRQAVSGANADKDAALRGLVHRGAVVDGGEGQAHAYYTSLAAPRTAKDGKVSGNPHLAASK